MLNLNRNDQLIELNCRTWWAAKNDDTPADKTESSGESLPFEQSNHHRDAAVAPASVFFVIELV